MYKALFLLKGHAMRIAFVSILLFVLAACAVVPEQGAERVALTPVSFSDLDGWRKDSHAATLTAFQRSCSVLASKKRKGMLQ